MKLLLTGAAGFIGAHVARCFLDRGDTVLGVDNLNDYYSVQLKHARLATLGPPERFRFEVTDVSSPAALASVATAAGGIDAIVHLAAQAGVRYSVENPYAYLQSNVFGQAAVFELAVRLPGAPPVIYASSSSVYGSNHKVPFSENDPVDHPVSLYAATKRAGELLAHSYGQTHGVASVGLRLFTVYGPFGRPDMAPWLFTDAILNGRPIAVYNNGEMERDFTHVADIAAGVLAAVDRIVSNPGGTAPIYNLGNSNPVRLLDFIAEIESATGHDAVMEMRPMPAGDVLRTFADIRLAARDLGFRPTVELRAGIADFVEWFRRYRATTAAAPGSAGP